ncbi:dihydrofolate reductase family protein [Microlunatus aurantiacus]|uniref:Dihydrofolate reductase family protein n=1 Tax=Microlunatus aurantiacus TaxID=446786 RepID=A0ABP7CGZ3_9ACTN
MRSVVLYTLMSLDGVAQSPDDFILDWDDRLDANLAEVIAEQDAVLLGRGMYEEWAAYWPTSDVEPFASFINSVQKYVVGSREPAADWGPRTVVTDDLATFVAGLKQTEGSSIGVHGSVTLARSMLAADLIDELRLVIAPVTAGSGQRLFGETDLKRWTLLASEVSPAGELVLHYRRRTD